MKNQNSYLISEENCKLLKKYFPDYENKVTDALFEQFSEIITGKRKFTKLIDLQSNFLFLLIKNVYQENFPSNQNIRQIFKTTESETTKIINNFISIYDNELENLEIKEKAMKLVFSKIEVNDESEFQFVCESLIIFKYLNDLLQVLDSSAESISKVNRTPCKYKIKADSYFILGKEIFSNEITEFLSKVSEKNKLKIDSKNAIQGKLVKILNFELRQNNKDEITQKKDEYNFKEDSLDFLRGKGNE